MSKQTAIITTLYPVTMLKQNVSVVSLRPELNVILHMS